MLYFSNTSRAFHSSIGKTVQQWLVCYGYHISINEYKLKILIFCTKLIINLISLWCISLQAFLKNFYIFFPKKIQVMNE